MAINMSDNVRYTVYRIGCVTNQDQLFELWQAARVSFCADPRNA